MALALISVERHEQRESGNYRGMVCSFHYRGRISTTVQRDHRAQ